MLSVGSYYPRESAGDEEETSTTQEGAFDTVGIQMSGTAARLLFGRAPYAPRVTVPLSRVAVSGDIGDLVGYLNTDGATVGLLYGTNASISDTLFANTAAIPTAYTQTTYANSLFSNNGQISNLECATVETPSITTSGQQIYCDFLNNVATNLPSIALLNCPLNQKNNSDNTTGGFSIENLFIGAAEGLLGDAAMYLAKQGGGWLLSAAQDGLSLLNGFASLGDGAMSIGADASTFGTAAASEAAIFEGEGLVMASSASEAASLFSSAGVLAEGGLAFSSELGEIGEGLLTGIQSSTAELTAVEELPGFIETLLGSGRWVAF